MTRVLAIDTSQQWCSVALSQDGSVIAHHSEYMPSGHSDVLAPRIQKLLQEVQLEPKDMDMIATIIGPGSFTGLRVSLATAQGMGLALSIPVMGFDTFSAYGACIQSHKNILVVIDSQKQDIYCQLFSPQHKALKDACSLDPSQIASYIRDESFILTGTGLSKITPYIKGAFDVVNVSTDDICQKISLMAYATDLRTQKLTQPFYLKDAIAQKPPKTS
jgi:tRNA threonylcarbamoyladenosine biosynthesis protein TsaB